MVELVRYPQSESVQTLLNTASDPSDLVRLATATTSSILPIARASEVILALAADPVKAVRMEIAQMAMALPRESLSETQQKRISNLTSEYIQNQTFNADRAESRANLATLAMRQNNPDEAINLFHQAITMDPYFAGGYIGLSHMFSSLGRNQEADQWLSQGIQKLPSNANLHHALGLQKIRQKQYPMAILSLRNAATLAPDISQYQYVYAIALADIVDVNQGIDVLQKALKKQPNNEQLLSGLLELHYQGGNKAEARKIVSRLLELTPDNRDYQQYLGSGLNL